MWVFLTQINLFSLYRLPILFWGILQSLYLSILKCFHQLMGWRITLLATWTSPLCSNTTKDDFRRFAFGVAAELLCFDDATGGDGDEEGTICGRSGTMAAMSHLLQAFLAKHTSLHKACTDHRLCYIAGEDCGQSNHVPQNIIRTWCTSFM